MITHIRGIGKVRGILCELRARQTAVRRHIWQRWHNPAGHTTPVFLVGCGRSGTSMVVRHLSVSWRTDLFNEDNPAAFERYRLRAFTVIASLIDRSHAQIAIFKPILDTCQTRVLLSQFPTAKVMFAFRHYDDVINSSLKRFGTTNRLNHVNRWVNDNFSEFAETPPPEETKDFIRARWNASLSPESGAALYWLFYNRLYYDLHLDREERARLVCYESVVLDPEREFKALCEFIGLPYEPKMSQDIFSSSIRRDSVPYIDPVIRADCEELWRCLCQDADTQLVENLSSRTT